MMLFSNAYPLKYISCNLAFFALELCVKMFNSTIRQSKVFMYLNLALAAESALDVLKNLKFHLSLNKT